MKFVSLFNPVSLPSDPDGGNEGDLYYNSSSYVYRASLGGKWINLVDENNVHYLTSNNIIEYGDESTVSFAVTLNESFENNTIYAISSSTSYIIINNNIDYPVRTGAEFNIVRGGQGKIEIISASPSIMIFAPSTSYFNSQWDTMTVVKLKEDTWLIQGEFRDLY